jgi:REP element-mobilizing transposase RayT
MVNQIDGPQGECQAMSLEPLYRPEGSNPAYQLRYTWTGWPSDGRPPVADVLPGLLPLWAADGLNLLEHAWTEGDVKLAFSTRPDVSPVFVAARAKGRLQHALSQTSGCFSGFSRKVAVRSVGDNSTHDVEAYIARQVAKEHFVDPRFEQLMTEFTVVCPQVDLSVPSESARGRYWYNLHLVLVVAQRDRIADRRPLEIIRDSCFDIARKKGHLIAALSVMPDHLHVALRGNIQSSPQEIALGFQNNLAFRLGQVRIWRDGFYVGTFSEYDMGAIRIRSRRSCAEARRPA